MIHVDAQPEPAAFDSLVRQKGTAFLKKQGFNLSQPLPPGTHLEPYWRACLDDLYDSYQGVCSYICVFFERPMGGGSVDHYVAKSQQATLAYEWNNYRLACATMNSRKRDYDDVLDPFEIQEGWFHLDLELLIGRIHPNPELPVHIKSQVQSTINRLGLDRSEVRKMRARHFQDYHDGFCNKIFLKKYSPFVWSEARRQNLL